MQVRPSFPAAVALPKHRRSASEPPLNDLGARSHRAVQQADERVVEVECSF